MILSKLKSLIKSSRFEYFTCLFKFNLFEWRNLLFLIKDYIDWIKFKQKCQLEENEWGIVCPASIGDTYYVAAFAEAFKKQHPKDILVIIVIKRHYYIPTLFPSIDRIVVVDSIPVRALSTFSSFEKGEPIYGHFRDVSFNNILGYKGIHLLDLHRAVLYLPMSTKLSLPCIPRKDKNKLVKDFFSSYNLVEKQTLILFPTANSLKMLNWKIWTIIAEKAKQKGWIVCCNSINKDHCIKDTIILDIKLEDLIPICEHAGWIIMQRSGLSDLISTAKVKKTILYNNDYNILWSSEEFTPYSKEFSTMIDAYGLKVLNGTDDIEEYEINDENYDEIIKIIFR